MHRLAKSTRFWLPVDVASLFGTTVSDVILFDLKMQQLSADLNSRFFFVVPSCR